MLESPPRGVFRRRHGGYGGRRFGDGDAVAAVCIPMHEQLQLERAVVSVRDIGLEGDERRG